ncbi:MAG: PAS domain S-box protein [Desulfobacterales bacterium]|nr:PAS domain S-box protein [Desulfobacterales bacterium]
MRDKSEKERLLKAIDAFGRRFIVLSPDFEILAASRSSVNTRHPDIVGKKCYSVFHDRSTPCANCAAEEAMAQKKASLRPKPDVDLEVGRMPCRYAYPISQDGRIEAFVSMELDLPTRKGLEDVLQRSNAFLRKLLVSAVDAVIAADKKGRILIFNEMAGEILGYDAEKALEEIDISDLYPGEAAHEVMEKLRGDDHGGKGHLQYYHVDLITKNGETIPVNLNAAIVYEGDKEIATIGFFHDMREELRIKEELEKTQLQLLQAEKMASLGMLAAGVAHEINNPVAIMIEEAGWMGDLLEEEEFRNSENLREFKRALKQINTQGKRCKAITHKLLTFARKTDSSVETVRMNEIIEDVVSLSAQRAKYANVELKTRLRPDLPVTRISMSEMQQVLLNLINNAMDAMGKKGGVITLSSGVDQGRILVEVADDGPGISKSDLNKIFDPFFTTKPVGKGTGLGLFICYFIIKTMGGKIDVRSDIGAGATFRVRIPVSDDALLE